MKVASFNVNSIRARLPLLLQWLTDNQPDILCVQETKVQDVDFPTGAFDEAGYNYVFKGQKSYNGVAILSKTEITSSICGFDDEPKDQARLITAEISGIAVVNTYIPQGYLPKSEKFQYKLNWFKRLGRYFRKNFSPADPVLWIGDFNVAPYPIDVYDPEGLSGHVCFCPKVTEAFEAVMNWGFVDVFRKHCCQPGQYTFWDYRMRDSFRRNLGWRLDHIMAAQPLAEKCFACYIDKKPRSEHRPSDHTAIIAEFEW